MTKKIVQIPNGIVQEMVTTYDDGDIKVPLSSGVDLVQLLDGDEDPMFVTIDALSDTISGNKRRWTSDELHRIAEQVMKNKPDGYQGHLAPEERSSKAPDAVTMWLGAKVANHKGRNRLFIKGYVLPKASQFKDYLRKAAAAGKNVAVSVYGQAMETWNESLKAFEVSNFSLESIDWARPGAEGVPNSGFFKVTAEMNGEDEVDKIEILRATTIAEMTEYNPTLVQEMTDAAQAESQAIISEMTATLGISDSKEIIKTISEMKSAQEALLTQVAHNEVDKILGSKVTNVAARGALRRMVISEMNSTDVTQVAEMVTKVLATPEGTALVDAFKTPVITPTGNDNRDRSSASRFIKK